MSSIGPEFHAQRSNGPISSSLISERHVYNCGVCNRKWVSRLYLSNFYGRLPSKKRRCFNCNAMVYPENAKSEFVTAPLLIDDADDKNAKPSDIYINICEVRKEIAMFTKEAFTGMPLLLDSGAEVSVIGVNQCGGGANILPTTVSNIKGVSGRNINVLGMCHYPLDIGFQHVIHHNFLVVKLNLSYGILGLDFMKEHGVILDPRAAKAYLPSNDSITLSTFSEVINDRELTDPVCKIQWVKSLFVDRLVVSSSNKDARAKEAEIKCYEMLKSFPNLTQEPDYNKPLCHNFKLDINLVDKTPIMQKPRKFTQAEHDLIKAHMEDLVKRGALVRGSSEYVSPVVLVPKKNGKTRICIDYTKLNAQTATLNFPIPLIQDLSYILKRNHCWFSVVDLREAYYSLPLTKRATERAAIITYQGVFKPLRTQFGLKNAPAKFCELISTMIRGLENFVFYYLDDLLIFSETIEDHVKHVKCLFERISSFGMVIQTTKCNFCETEVKYLGYKISKQGLLPLHDNILAINEVTRPTNLQELRRFIGMINYYHSFVPKIASILSPLHELLKGKQRPKRRKIDWEEKHQIAFEQAKRALINATCLVFDDAGKSLILTTDGSGTHCGAVLEIPVNNDDNELREVKPIAFFSKCFAPSTRYWLYGVDITNTHGSFFFLCGIYS